MRPKVETAVVKINELLTHRYNSFELQSTAAALKLGFLASLGTIEDERLHLDNN